jgi:hypothetical protein
MPGTGGAGGEAAAAVAQERAALANIHALLAALERRQRGAASDAEAHQARLPFSGSAYLPRARVRARAQRARPSISIADRTASTGSSRQGLGRAVSLRQPLARAGQKGALTRLATAHCCTTPQGGR